MSGRPPPVTHVPPIPTDGALREQWWRDRPALQSPEAGQLVMWCASSGRCRIAEVVEANDVSIKVKVPSVSHMRIGTWLPLNQFREIDEVGMRVWLTSTHPLDP